MKYRFGLMGKIAVSLFISSLIIMFLGITVLYTRFRKYCRENGCSRVYGHIIIF